MLTDNQALAHVFHNARWILTIHIFPLLLIKKVSYSPVYNWIQVGGIWKTKKLCTNQWLSMLFSPSGSPLKANSQLRRWSDLNASDIKIFVAHLSVMEMVKKSNTAKYWSTNSLTRTPFFCKILSRNIFQNILMNLHISDNNTDHPHDNLNHDPLHKVRAFI